MHVKRAEQLTTCLVEMLTKGHDKIIKQFKMTPKTCVRLMIHVLIIILNLCYSILVIDTYIYMFMFVNCVFGNRLLYLYTKDSCTVITYLLLFWPSNSKINTLKNRL